jgi:uncharacterized protein (DUF1697 family)
MPTYVALLRGIGPSMPNMRNEKLRWLFEQLGFKNVRTVISSGNVLFESTSERPATLEIKIEKALPEKLGFTSTTIIRSVDQLEKLVKKDPFKGWEDTASSRLNVTFLKQPQKPKFKFPHRPEKRTYQLLSMVDDAICSVIDLEGDKTPDLMIWLEKEFGKQITTRTWKTVGRILKKMKE